MEPEEYDYVPSVFAATTADDDPPKWATRGQRLLNFIVDGTVCLLLYYPVGYLLSAALYRFGVDLFDAVTRPLQAWPAALVLLLLIAGAYYFVIEVAMCGRSIGKWLTGTVAVGDDGVPITPRNALVRSLCRLIPFEPFSALAGRPWHDRFSKTQVVKRRKTFASPGTMLPDSSANYDVVR